MNPRQEKLEPLSNRLLLVAAIPFVLLAIMTIVFRCTNLDLELASLFYDQPNRIWSWRDSPICRLGYHWLPVPGILMGIFGGLIFASKSLSRKTGISRPAGLFLLVVLLVGPVLIVNTVAKPLWARPRPYHVTQFSGKEAFAPVLSNSFPSTSRSFPSGHASMGFVLMAPCFLLIRRRRKLGIAFFALGIGMGGLLGLVRMAEGGHFASDVIWSGGVVYASCLVTAFAYRGTLARNHNPHSQAGLHSGLLEASRERWLQLERGNQFVPNEIIAPHEEQNETEPDRRAA